MLLPITLPYWLLFFTTLVCVYGALDQVQNSRTQQPSITLSRGTPKPTGSGMPPSRKQLFNQSKKVRKGISKPINRGQWEEPQWTALIQAMKTVKPKANTRYYFTETVVDVTSITWAKIGAKGDTVVQAGSIAIDNRDDFTLTTDKWAGTDEAAGEKLKFLGEMHTVLQPEKAVAKIATFRRLFPRYSSTSDY